MSRGRENLAGRREIAAALLVTVSSLACNASPRRPAAIVEGGLEGGLPPVTLAAPHTSAAEIALSNLAGEIADRERRPDDGDAQRELVGRYLMRAQFAGRIADLETALGVSARVVAARDQDPGAHLTRARALSAVHEFSRAGEELRRAAELHAEPTDVARQRFTLLLAQGEEDEALAIAPGPVDLLLPADLTMRGALMARLGRPSESEELFEKARIGYRDTSPFTVAWMDFERARALEIAGDRLRARAYLLEAATVLPGYAHAVAHLASQEPPDRALARLGPLEATSDDPDVLAAAADALRRLGRADDARATADRARRRYEELLARLPLAFADHAAQFYLAMGADAGRALSLARSNADNRPNDEALELWLTAAEAARAPRDACEAGRRLTARPHAPSAMRERAERALGRCP